MTTTQPTQFLNGSRGLTITETCAIVTDEKGSVHTFPFAAPEQAHRAALAILTGPGKVEPDGDVSDPARMSLEEAVSILRNHFAALDARAAAEAEAAELDRRAKIAYSTRMEPLPVTAPIWDVASEEVRDAWRAVIRAIDADAEARRLHTNKETQHG